MAALAIGTRLGFADEKDQQPGIAAPAETVVELSDGEVIVITESRREGRLDEASQTDWDLAFKRSAIKLNGGISGPGAVEVATASGAVFATRPTPAT